MSVIWLVEKSAILVILNVGNTGHFDPNVVLFLIKKKKQPSISLVQKMEIYICNIN